MDEIVITRNRQYERQSGTCTGPECDRDAVTHGLCNTHYQQVRKGRPLTVINGNKARWTGKTRKVR